MKRRQRKKDQRSKGGRQEAPSGSRRGHRIGSKSPDAARQAPEGGVVPKSGQFEPSEGIEPLSDVCPIPSGSLGALAVEIWRLQARIRGTVTPDPVCLAVERIGASLGRLGLQVRDLQGEPYDEGLLVRVIEHEPGDGPRTISECLSPAVYYQGRLLKAADVVTKGDSR